MATDVTFPPGVQTAATQRVYVRQRWADDWQLVPALHCAEAARTVAPTLPTATLIWLYGQVKTTADAGYQLYAKTDLKRWFIKVEFDSTTAGEPWTWYGFVDDVVDQWGGEVDGVATGREQLICYGLEKLLTENVIRDSHVQFQLAADVIGRPLTFNHAGLPNRSAELQGAAYVFENDPDAAEYWSSWQILEYLLRYQAPRDLELFRLIPFAVDLASYQPHLDADRPVLDQRGATVYSLLSRLLDRRRLVVWWLEVEQLEGQGDQVLLKLDTLTAQQITLPTSEIVQPNAAQVNLRCGSDPTTKLTIVDAGVPVFDQVQVRGPRIRVVGTFAVVDGTLVAGWDDALTSDYLDAASGEVGYGGADVREQQRWNEEVRSRPELADVFRLYVLPDNWSGEVGDGLGGAQNPLFYLHKDSVPAIPYGPELRLEQSLPLKVGVDYSGSNIADGNVTLPTRPSQELAPLVLFKRPDAARWVLAQELGTAAAGEITDQADNPRFTVWVEVSRELAGLRLTVNGQPQHAIAYDGFTPLPADYDVGEYDVAAGGMLATLSIESDWHTDAWWPTFGLPDEPPLPAIDAARVKLIHAPDRGQQVYVAPDTVVGVDATGALVTSGGGWIGEDDIPELVAVAKLAAAWYTVAHYLVYLTTTRLLAASELGLGNLVLQVGESPGQQQTVNSIVTSIEIHAPPGPPEGETAPTMQITTWAGELETLELVPDRSAIRRQR